LILTETELLWGFATKPAEQVEFDLLGCGALGVRLSPEEHLLETTRQLVMYGPTGAEYNPVANAVYAFGLRGLFCTALVEQGALTLHPLAEWIRTGMQAIGVQGEFRRFRDNGRGNPSHALVFSDAPVGERKPNVFYYRDNEAGRLLEPGMFDWDKLMLRTRAALSGGLFAALSQKTAALIIEMAQAAKRHGVPFSFDVNWRPKLWADSGGLEFARQVYDQILPNVTAGFGNESDWGDATGIEASTHEERILKVVERYPNLKVVGTSLRDIVGTNRHQWSGMLYANGKFYYAPKADINVLDRVGGGDAFHAGVMAGILRNVPPQDAVLWGWAAGALKASCRGDLCLVKEPEILAMAKSKGDPDQRRIAR
jgi:2-dehydro-3-deoxygluconokinase